MAITAPSVNSRRPIAPQLIGEDQQRRIRHVIAQLARRLATERILLAEMTSV
jgi:hypothetical protein